MAAITLPTTRGFVPSQFVLTLNSSFAESRSPYSGYLQTVEFAGSSYWTARITWPARSTASESYSAAIEGLVHRLRSRVDTLSLWDMRRPAPLGTMRSSPVLNGNVGQYGGTIGIRNVAAGATLLAGDKLGISGQLHTVTQNATADGSGVFSSVTIDPPVRAYRGDGTAVVWDKPTANFVLAQSEISFERGLATFESISIDLQEVL
jgi:hypothetical protein